MNIENEKNLDADEQINQQTEMDSIQQVNNGISEKPKKYFLSAVVVSLSTILLLILVLFYFFNAKKETGQTLNQAQPTLVSPMENTENSSFLYLVNGQLWFAEPSTNKTGLVSKRLIDEQLRGAYVLSNSKTKVAYISNSYLKVKDLLTDEVIALHKVLPNNYSEVESEQYIRAVGNFSWSSDDAQLVFVGVSDLQADLYTIDIDGENLKRLTNDEINEFSPVWSPDNEKIAFQTTTHFGSGAGHSSNIIVIDNDGSNYSEIAVDSQLPDGRSFMPALNLQWIDNNKISFIAFGPMLYDGVWQADVNSGEITSLIDELEFASHVWSEENKSLLLPLMEKDLLILNANGESERIETIGKVVHLAWSHDGSKIAFSVERSTQEAGVQQDRVYDLFLVNDDGSDLKVLLSDESYSVVKFSFYSNNESILYQKKGVGLDASSELWSINIDGSNNRLIDSSKILVGSAPDSNMAIYARGSLLGDELYDYYLLNLETLSKEIILENTEFIYSFNFLNH